MAARAGVEPTTLRLRVIASTNAPPCPTYTRPIHRQLLVLFRKYLEPSCTVQEQRFLLFNVGDYLRLHKVIKRPLPFPPSLSRVVGIRHKWTKSVRSDCNRTFLVHLCRIRFYLLVFFS